MRDATKDRHQLGCRAAELTPAVRNLMEAAARQALLPRFGMLAEGESEEKSPGEVVTIADRECEIILSEGLAGLLPEASVVGEEAAHADPGVMQRLADDLCWIIDPLDGTGYFAAGQQPFGIMVALAAEGSVIGGWILDPLSGRLCWAAAGGGCWIDGSRVSLDKGTKPTTIGLSALLKQRPARLEAVLSQLAGQFGTHDIPRCAAAHYPAMLLGAPAVTYFERTLPWDHAPGALMIEEAGGSARRLDRSAYRVDDDRVGLLVATDPASWQHVSALLQDLPE